ncbi:MAG: thermonuclease family protein [Planctomycetes bacterium]|nr:thermonuclease family protein [Planctomycetota bacterium]
MSRSKGKRGTGNAGRPGSKKGTGRSARPSSSPGGPSPLVVVGVALVVLLLLGVALFVAFRDPPAQATPTPSATTSPSLAPSQSRPKKTPTPKATPKSTPTPEPRAPTPTPEPAKTPEPVAPVSGGAATVEISGVTESVEVRRVIDGDTLVLTDGRKIRLLGINTPERGRPFKEEATDALRELTSGNKITIEYDGPKAKAFGNYKRTLAYIHCKGVFVNGEIIRRGLAYVTIYPNTRSHNSELIAWQREARAANLNLWSQPLPAAASLYIGNKRAPYFHREGCRRIKKLRKGRNRVEFTDRNEALDSGMNPCGDCKS